MPNITGDVATLTGAEHSARNPAALWIEASRAVIPVAGTSRLAGLHRVTIAGNGTFSEAGLPATVGDVPLYRLRIVSASLRVSGTSELVTGWFPLTENRDLAWIVANYVPTTVISEQTAVDVAAAAALGATNDTATASFVNNPASATRAALEGQFVTPDALVDVDADAGSDFRVQQDARLATTFARVYTPEAYGAAGDGVTDDSAEVQAAFTAAGNDPLPARVQLDKSYRVTTNLYGFGTTTFEGGGELVVDADLSLSDGIAYWWNMGIKSKGGTRSTWSGRMSVNIRATVNAVYERTINLHLAEDCTITRCRFDLTAMTTIGIEYPGGAIVGYDNSGWCTNPSRRRVWITENTFLANQTAAIGSECVGIGPAQHVWILDNYTHGFGDDPIAIHAVDHFTVRGNRCFSRDGRLIIRSSRWGVVSDNHLERIANPNGTFASGGGLFEFNLYDAGSWHASTGVVVKDNYLHLPAGVTGPTYMMRAKGIRDCTISGNEFHSDSPDTTVAALTVEAEPLAGWVDPAGVDTDAIAKVYKLRVTGNFATGSQPRRLSENGANIIGPVTYSDNLFTGYAVTSTGSVVQRSNRVIGGSPDGFTAVDGKLIPDATLLFEGDLSVNNTGVTKVTRNGVDRWYPRRKCIITSVELETSATITAGFFTLQLKKNGGSAAASEDVPIDTSTPRGRRVSYYAGTNNRAAAATDYFEFVTQGSGLAPDPTLCRVRVFGVYTDIA